MECGVCEEVNVNLFISCGNEDVLKISETVKLLAIA